MILLALLFVLIASHVQAANYYVATTGNDTTGTGAVDNPWRNPQKCVDAGAPLVAGDTCIVRSGTYEDSTGNHYVVLANGSTAPQGTPSNPITLKSEVPNGAVIQLGTGSSGAGKRGFYINRQHYVIEGFRITGGSGTDPNISLTGILHTSTGLTIRRNFFDSIGTALCSNSSFAVTAISLQGTGNVTVEYNYIYNTGRRRNGESGCSTNKFQHDHGIYSQAQSGLTIKHNLFYDNVMGYSITLFKSGGGTHLNNFIYNNTFRGKSPTGAPAGQVNTCNTLSNVVIRNNIFSDTPSGYGIQHCSSVPNVVSFTVTHNLSDTTAANLINPSPAPTGNATTYNNNTLNTSPGFTDASGSDFTLTSSSAAINAGVSVGLPFSGSAPDIGAFETFGPVAASITASLLDVTYNPAFGPLQVGGAAGHSVGCSPTCGTLTVANASLFSSSSSIARYTVSGFSGGNCVDTQTITKSFNASTGTLTDSINIGGTLNQPVHTYGPIAVTNQCTGGGSPPPPATPSHILYELDGDETDTSGNGLNGTRSGGSYVAGKYGQALQGTDGTAVSVTAPYGSGVNPSTQDLSIVIGYEVPAGAENLTRTIAGASLGTNQRLHITAQSGTWQIAVGSSSTSISTPSNLPVKAGYNRLVLLLNSTTDVATLYADNIQGTGGATKAIPDYTLASDFAFGLPSGFNAAVAGGGKWDRVAIYTSLIDPNEDWLAWEPPSSPSVGTYAQTGARWLRVMDDGAAGPVLYSEAGTVNVVQGGAVIYQSRTACSGANCSAIGEKLWYTHDGGTAQEVPNSFTSTGVSFWGANTSASMYLGAAVWSPSSNGTTQTTNVAQPTIELAEDASIVRNSVLRFADDATGTYCFHERDQNGNELDSVPTACVVVIPPQASGGF